jgi:hypothetical protein
MGRTKSDISNSAIRIFLQNVGKFYDKARGYDPFVPKKQQKVELLSCFENKCCYCDTSIDFESISQDHLIPMNKTSLGLHCWGNVVPCCKDCNNEKQQKPWIEFLKIKTKNDEIFNIRKGRIEDFVNNKKYDPNLNLKDFAGNLYEDVGEVAMTLINLRYKQAADGINEVLKK